MAEWCNSSITAFEAGGEGAEPSLAAKLSNRNSNTNKWRGTMAITTKYVIYILKSSGEDGYFISLKDSWLGVYEIRLADSTSRAKWFDTEESAKFIVRKIEHSLGYYTEIRPIRVNYD